MPGATASVADVGSKGRRAGSFLDGAPRLLHRLAHLRGLRRDRERVRVDAPRIEPVADEAGLRLNARAERCG